VEAVKVSGKTHGALAEAAEEQAEQDQKVTFSLLTLVGTQAIMEDQEALQKVLQAEVQDAPTQTILETDHRAGVVEADFMDLLAEAADAQEE
jgi:hypothetical protein